MASAITMTSAIAHFQPYIRVTGGATSATIIHPAGTQVCLIENSRLRCLGGLNRNKMCAAAGVMTLIAAPSRIDATIKEASPGTSASTSTSATTLTSNPAWIARHAPWLLQEPREANTFIALAEQGKEKRDDVLQQVTVRVLDRWIRDSGFRLLYEDRQVTGFFRRVLPGPLRRRMERTAWVQDVMIGHIQCVLEKP